MEWIVIAYFALVFLTLIENATQPPDPEARPMITRLASRKERSAKGIAEDEK